MYSLIDTRRQLLIARPDGTVIFRLAQHDIRFARELVWRLNGEQSAEVAA